MVVLHAQRHAVEALGAQLAQQRRVHAVRVGLEGDLGVLVHAEAVQQLCEDAAQIVRAEERGRAAAEIDRVHHVVRGARAGLLEVGRQGLHIVVHQLPVPAAAETVEVAVLALAPAERNVDIDS